MRIAKRTDAFLAVSNGPDAIVFLQGGTPQRSGISGSSGRSVCSVKFTAEVKRPPRNVYRNRRLPARRNRTAFGFPPLPSFSMVAEIFRKRRGKARVVPDTFRIVG